MRQTYLIGNHLPASVFGVGVILLLGVNPLLGLVGYRWQLRAGEIALVVAMGLAVCAWPGSNLLRIFSSLVFQPTRPSQMRMSWQATEAMAYTPGVSARLAQGYVEDWPALVAMLRRPDASNASAAATRIHARLKASLKARLTRIPVDGEGTAAKPNQADRRQIIGNLNRVIEDPTFYSDTAFATDALSPDTQRLIAKRGEADLPPPQVRALNRSLLVETFPAIFRAQPRGEGVLLGDGHPSAEVADPLVVGSPDRVVDPTEVPWSAWWPTLRLWLGLALAVGLAGACMILIVHPQWTRHERLAYPIVQFLGELARTEEGRALPNIARNRLFWIGVGLVGTIHLSNGLHAWFEPWIEIPLSFDFSAFRTLLTTVRQVAGSGNFFHPTIYPAVIGFGFFIGTRAATSLGLSLIGWMGLGAYLISNGVALNDGRYDIDANGNGLRFGAYLAIALMILYFGRRFYCRVALDALGLGKLGQTFGGRASTGHPPKDPEEGTPPSYSKWGARGMGASTAAGVFLLVRYAGLGWPLALLMIGIVLIVLLVLARLNAEMGLFYAQPGFIPATLLAGLFGVEGLGPEALIVLLLASTVLLIDPRSSITPFIANGLRMTEELGDTSPRRTAWPLGICIVLGLVVGTVATLTIQYNLGLAKHDGWANGLPIWAYGRFADSLAQLEVVGRLQSATGGGTWSWLTQAQPDSSMIWWTLLGLGLALGCSIGRIRFPWWPIHPVLFIVWGTYPANHFAFSFLLAAAIKFSVLRTGGIRAFNNIKPLMVGLIVADILAVIGWSIVGAIYYLLTDLPPETYRIFPG